MSVFHGHGGLGRERKSTFVPLISKKARAQMRYGIQGLKDHITRVLPTMLCSNLCIETTSTSFDARGSFLGVTAELKAMQR